MSTDSNSFRLAAYLGAGAIFIALLAFIIFGFPDPAPVDPNPGGAGTKSSRDSNFGKFSSGGSGGRNLNSASETAGDKNDAIDPSIAGEVIIRGKSKQELAKILTRALESGGEFKGLIREVWAARIKFPSREAAEQFRDSLDDTDLSDSNYIVMAPDFPDEGAERNATTGEPLKPFGDGALKFLGVEGDNSAWGKDLTIAILDSGVYAHESLTGINIKQIDLIQTAEGAPADQSADYSGHGTAVADVAHSLAPAADLLSVRVLDGDGIGDTFTVSQGIIAAADQGAQIINLSLGSYGDSSVLRDAVNYAVDKGAAVVAASGNDGIQQVSYPAAYENVIGVTAVDANGTFADFSNTGDGVDISAPGVGVYTAWGEDQRMQFSGTSAASPFVSAAVAATMTLNEGYTVGQAAEQVQQSARDTGDTGQDPQTGNGILFLGK